MKKLLILFCLIFAGIGMVSGQVNVTSSTGLFEEPSLKSKRITTVVEGEKVTLGEKTGDFWKVSIGGKIGYIHKTCLSNYADPNAKVSPEYVIIPVAPKAPPAKVPDTVRFEQYGGIFSIGIALGGGGLIGVPIRLSPTRDFAIEIGAYGRGMISNTSTYAGLNLNGGCNVYFKDSYNPKKKKIRHDGAFFRIGKTFYNADINEFLVMGGWTRDHFKLGVSDKVFTLELGAGLNSFTLVETTSGSWGYQTTTVTGKNPMLFWKFGWSICSKKR
jgi:hypothetical protein